MPEFKDHFSIYAGDYARYRPTYPLELFAYLASLCPERQAAWDCATGNGQAALKLALHFKNVIATDGSEAQLKSAEKHSNIDYRVATAEHTNIASKSIDLITVAQALHWFNAERFFEEAKRVLKPAGVIAVWCYKLLEIVPEIDEIIQNYYYNTVYSCWPPERRILENHYQSIPFPFRRIETPQFYMVQHWDCNALLGYMYTWSATRRFIKSNRYNPLDELSEKLKNVWGNLEEKKTIEWPIYLQAGKL